VEVLGEQAGNQLRPAADLPEHREKPLLEHALRQLGNPLLQSRTHRNLPPLTIDGKSLLPAPGQVSRRPVEKSRAVLEYPDRSKPEGREGCSIARRP
jgi:hypothetical protein